MINCCCAVAVALDVCDCVIGASRLSLPSPVSRSSNGETASGAPGGHLRPTHAHRWAWPPTAQVASPPEFTCGCCSIRNKLPSSGAAFRPQTIPPAISLPRASAPPLRNSIRRQRVIPQVHKDKRRGLEHHRSIEWLSGDQKSGQSCW